MQNSCNFNSKSNHWTPQQSYFTDILLFYIISKYFSFHTKITYFKP